MQNTKQLCNRDGWNMNSTSPLCVHGDYSGVQLIPNSHTITSTYKCPCAEGVPGNSSYGSGMSVICNFARCSHLTLYAKSRGAGGANHLGKMVDVILGEGDIVVFDHGVIHGKHKYRVAVG